jgi:2-polyprenyl-3-methyl-5-hydroxy-6-metoxy-1,4-benzoquinol methylase
MIKRMIKNIVYIFLNIYINTIGKLLYIVAKKYASFHTKTMHFLEWNLQKQQPSSYKHEINLYNWMYDPSQVQFADGGVFGRMLIQKNDKVLDLCCGDGSYAYLFYSDIASKVDAIDYDAGSIKYAKNMYYSNNINYICKDLLNFSFEQYFYNVIIWKAGIAYFTKENRSILFKKIFNSLKNNGKVYISTPLEDNITLGANQVEVITNLEEFEQEFNKYFIITFKQRIIYSTRININYILEKI